ncbi:hypothetical protein PR048_020996 [Dryococelus australis]|uniref:Uncharacterized protein n=1 Tax=Dryococelus australis TaxID=614101 RepID=A0ABQ9GWZ3_9NEOP|nr:hypothetical protein PR048_020996 [Dryococelus australis]
MGPHQNVQVVTIRGLFVGMWNNCSCCVWVEKNLKVWKELCTNRTLQILFAWIGKYRAFYDKPHLLKLFRNHFIDDSVTLPDGTVFGRKVFKNTRSTRKETSP